MSIVLIGMMGSGKTTVGKALAKRLGWRFLDLDRIVEQKAGRRIQEIFEQQGEEAFRRMETSALREIEGGEPYVLACGGGTPFFEDNEQLLWSMGTVVYLRHAADVLWSRVSANRNRPLAQSGEARFSELLAQREPKYMKAHLVVDCGRMKPNRIAHSIFEQLRLAQ
jgi:3-dehydroquinate synthase